MNILSYQRAHSFCPGDTLSSLTSGENICLFPINASNEKSAENCIIINAFKVSLKALPVKAIDRHEWFIKTIASFPSSFGSFILFETSLFFEFIILPLFQNFPFPNRASPKVAFCVKSPAPIDPNSGIAGLKPFSKHFIKYLKSLGDIPVFPFDSWIQRA